MKPVPVEYLADSVYFLMNGGAGFLKGDGDFGFVVSFSK